MKGHQQHLIVISFHGIDISDESNLLQETGKCRIFVFFLIRYDLGNQLIDIFDPGFCLFGTLGFQLVYISCFLNNVLRSAEGDR